MRRPKFRIALRLLSGLLILTCGLPRSSAHALRGEQPEHPRQRSGLEEELRPAAGMEELDEEAQLQAEIDLSASILAQESWEAKIRVAGRVSDDAVRHALGRDPGRTRVVLAAVRHHQDRSESKPDILVAETGQLQRANRRGAWKGPTGTVFMTGEVWSGADAEAIRRAFEQDNFDELERWASARDAPPAPVPPAQPPTPPPAPPAAPPAVQPAAPPAAEPALPTPPPERRPGRPPVTGAEAVNGALRETAEAAFSGWALPNVTGVTKLDATGQNLLVWHDSSEADSFGGTGMLILGAMPRPMPLTPAPVALRGETRVAASGRYQARFLGLKAIGEVEQRHPELKELVPRTHEGIHEVLGMMEQPKRRWVRQRSETVRRMAGRRDGALERWSADEPGQADDLLERIRRFQGQHQRLERAIQEAVAELRRAAEAGQVPAARAREILAPLRDALGPWPRTQMAVDQHRDRMSEGSVELRPFLELVEESTREAVRQQEWMILLAAIPPGQREVLYDAYRTVWLERLAELQRSADTLPLADLDNAVLEAHRIARWLAQHEWNAGITRHLNGNVRGEPPREQERVTNLIVQAGGVLLVSADGRPRRFIPGGGAIYSGGDLASRYLPFQIQAWFQPGDRVVLVYPSITGSPSIEHLDFYTEDWFLLRQMLPGAPEIWLGTLTADGTLRVYRPRPAAEGEDSWRSASESVAFALDRYDSLRYLLQGKLYVPPPEVAQGGAVTERAVRRAGGIARSLGKRLPKQAVVRKAVAGVDPLFRWLQGIARGEMLRLFREGLTDGFGQEAADELLGELRARFRGPLAEVAKPKKGLRELNQEVPALAQQIQMVVAERIGEQLLSEDPFLELVEVEGVSVVEPPSFEIPGEPETGEPGEAGAAAQPVVATQPSQVDPESLAPGIAADFIRRSRITENKKRFFGDASEAEIEAFARPWVLQRLRSGERKPRFVRFGKDFLAERNKPKPSGPTPEELARQAAEELARQAAELAQQAAEQARRAAEGVRDQLHRQIGQLPRKLRSREEVERAQAMIAELDRQLPTLEALPELSADVEEIRAERTRLTASIGQAERRFEREERDERRRKNDEILDKSSSTRQMAEVLRTDDRFSSYVSGDERAANFLREVSRGARPIDWARGIEAQFKGMDPRKMGEFQKRYHQGVLRLAGLIIQSGPRSGMEEGLHPSAGMEEPQERQPERLTAEVQEAIARGAPLRARITSVDLKGESAEVEYGSEGDFLLGRLPARRVLRWFAERASVPLRLPLAWLKSQEGKTLWLYPVAFYEGHAFPVLYAADLSPRGLGESVQPVLEELKRKRKDGVRMTIRVAKLAGRAGGAQVLYRGRDGVHLGFVRTGSLFDDRTRWISSDTKMEWLALREGSGEPFEADVERVVSEGDPWEEVHFRPGIPLTPALFTQERLFRTEILARRAKGKISEFLTWMLEGGVDPSDALLEWELSRGDWWGLTGGQKVEIFEWLAKNQHRIGQRPEQMFDYFEHQAGRRGALLGVKAWSVYGMHHSAHPILSATEKQARVRRRAEEVWRDAQEVEVKVNSPLRERIRSILADLPGIPLVTEEAGMEEDERRIQAEEAWEAAWVGFPDLERAGEHAFVVTEEALWGDGSRPGIGFHVQKLFELIPGLSLRVVAQDDERAAWIRQALGLPADQVKAPEQGQRYEDAVRGEIQRYQSEAKEVHLVHTARLNWGVDEILLPGSAEMWLENVSRIFRLLGFVGEAEWLGVNHYTAARLASEIFAERLA